MNQQRYTCTCGSSPESHLGANGLCVGVELGLGGAPPPRLPHQGSRQGRQGSSQGLVLVVRGHVGDTLASVENLIAGAYVEGRVVR